MVMNDHMSKKNNGENMCYFSSIASFQVKSAVDTGAIAGII